MPTAFDQATTIENQDDISRQDGGQAMGDYERGAAGEQRPQRRLDELLRECVEVRCGFVQDDDTRVLQDDASNRHALLLAAAESVAAFAHDRLVALRQ